MKFDKLRKDKGVAGLTILLSLITMLFVIGFLVMIFALMGGELAGMDTLSASESATTSDLSISVADATFNLTACEGRNEGTISALSEVYNLTVGAVALANFTTSGCTVSIVSGIFNVTTFENATYTYTFAGTGWETINETTTAIGTVTDWYPIFIVIGAMVVLILLTVIIITAIRGSGLMAGAGSNKSGGTKGSA